MSQSIAFIDASLAQNNLALKSFDGQVYVIPFGEDGVQYIADVLSRHQNLDAVHLFSHGAEAAIMLGKTVLSLATLQTNAAHLQSWQAALAPGADLLIYGCNVAAGPGGEAFITELSQMLGVDIAASEDLTGTVLGADWQLERASGSIEASATQLQSLTGQEFVLGTVNEGNPGVVQVTDDDTGVFDDNEGTRSFYTIGNFSTDFDNPPDGDILIVPDSFQVYVPPYGWAGPGYHGGVDSDSFGNSITIVWNVGDGNDVWYGDYPGPNNYLYRVGDNTEWRFGIYVFGGDDLVYAEGGNDLVFGGDGNDTLYGGEGDDTLHGEAGNDTLYGDADNDTLHGGDGDDTLYGNAGADTLHGGEGNNTIYAGNGAFADPDTGTHTITSGSGNDVIHGSQGVDIITVAGGTNDINAYNGNNVVTGGSGSDTIRTGSGSDTIRTRQGNDTVYAGAGNDIVTTDLANGSSGGGDNTFYGEAGNDLLRGGAGNDRLYGGDGDDYIEGGNGNDVLEGGAGNDILVYGDVSNGDVGPHPDPNNGGAPTLNPNTRDVAEIKVATGSGWRSATGQTTVDGGAGLDTLRVVGEYSDFNIATETLADGTMRFTVTDRNNAANQVVATNVEKIEFWNNYTVFPGSPTQRELHNRNGIILPIRYELEVLQHAQEQLYGSKEEYQDNNKVGQVKVQLKDWQNPTQNYVIDGDEAVPGSKRDEYSLGNGLAIKYEIVVTGSFGPEEIELLSDKLRFKRINLETGRSTTTTGAGLEYVIENFVVVQPGESSATISLLPILDEIQEQLETVEIRIVSMDRVEKADGGAATTAYAYQEGFLYANIRAANGTVLQGANNAENGIQDGINKGYVLMPVTPAGDRVTVNIADSGLFQAGLRLVDEYGFRVDQEVLLQGSSTPVFLGLTSRPANDVTVTVAGQNYVFTSDRNTWNQLQQVNLSGAPGTAVTFDVSSADPFYNGLSDRTLTLVDEQSRLHVPEPVALQIGAGNYVALPNIALAGNYALEFWVNPSSENGTLLQTSGGSLALVNGRLQGTSALSFVGNDSNQLKPQQWHRVSVLAVGDRLDVYVDGDRAGSQTIAPNTSLTLQSVGASGGSAQGLISSLRFWDQLVADGNLYVGTLKAQYNLDEGAGTNLNNQAPASAIADATVVFNNGDALLWNPGVPLADPALREMLAEEAASFGLVNRNFDFPQVVVSVPSDQQRTVEGSDQLAAFELLLSKPAPRGGITVNFGLSNLTLAEPGALRPSAGSGSAWQGLDFQVTTAVNLGGSAQTQTQNVSFGEGFTGSIYIPEGARKGVVYISAPDDERAEGNQRLQLTLGGVANADASRYQVAGASGTIAIVDTDRPGVEMLSLKSSYTYNPDTDRTENTTQLEPVKQIIVREADDGAMTLRFNLDDLRWDAQNYDTAEIFITDTAGLALSETKLSLTDAQRFAVTTVQGDFGGKILNGILTLNGVAQSFSLELVANQELADAESLRLSPASADLKLTFEQGHLLTNEGNPLPIRARQSSWNEYVYVQLTSAPIDGDGQVAVDLKATRSIVGSDEVALSTSRLTFTAADWDQPRLVGIRGVNDGFNDGSQLGQVTATIVTDPAQTTDAAYQFGGQGANLTYLNVAMAEPPTELKPEELVKLYQPPNPANPTYGFEVNAQTRQLTITEGETAQVTITADLNGQGGPLVGRYKVVETGLQRSLQLQGGSDHLALEDPIELGSRFTLQLGLRWSGNRDQGQPVQLVQGVNGHGDLAIATDGRLVAQFRNGQNQLVTVQSTVPLKANEAYQINLVSDGVSAQLYADGRLIGSGSLGATAIAPVTVTALFGSADVSSVDNFQGVVYGARFWNRELSQGEIRRFSQEVFNRPPLVFTLDGANSQVLFRLNPDLFTAAPTAPVELTFRRYSYTGGAEPAIATVTVTVDANNWQSLLTVPFSFGTSADLLADIGQITVQLSSPSDPVQTYFSNVGQAYELETLRRQHLIDEISPTDLSRFDRRPNFAEGGAIQGQDFEALEGVVVNKGASAKLPISGDRYLGDRPAVVTGDLTGDGRADLLILTEKAGAQFYENTSTKPGDLAFTPQDVYQPKVNTAGLAPGFSGSEARLVDVDSDGDLDLVWSQDGGLKVRLNQVENGVAFAGDPVVVALEDQTGSTLGSGRPRTLVGFDFADFSGDGVLDAVVLDGNNRIQAYLGNGAFTLATGLVPLADAANPFRSIVLPSDLPLALRFGDVVVDGQPELFVYERGGGEESYWRAFLPELDGSGQLSYRDRTYVDPLSGRAGQIGNLESLSFLNDSGVDSVFLSLDNGHYRFGTVAQKSNEVVFDPGNPQAVLEVVSRQDNVVELDERVRLQLLSTDDLTARPGLDRTVDILIRDDDRPGVTLAYVGGNGQPASVVASHLTASANPTRPLAEGQQSDGFYVLQLNSQPQDSVSLVLRNSASDRLQFERIYPFALTVNANGSLTVQSRLANSAADYSLRFSSPLVQSVSRDGQGAYTVQMTAATAATLQGAIAGKSVAEIQQSAAVQTILKQVGIRVDGDDATYRVGVGLNANQLLQERVSVTPQGQMKLTILPTSWDQQILLRPVAPDNLVDNGQDAAPRLSIAVDSSDAVYGNLPGLVAELPILDNDQAGVIINQLADIREGVEGGQFQVSLRSKPTGTVLVTLRPGDLAGNDSSALALDKKYYGDTIELKFTPYNWNAPQTVQVRAQDDNRVTGDFQSYVHARVQSDDPLYAGIAVNPVTVTVRDNDLPTVSAYTVLDASEPGQIGFFGLRLNTDQVRNPEGLKIHYRVKGWASAPASADDYQQYVNLTPEGDNFLFIAPGQSLGNVVIFPIDDYIAEGFDLTFKANGVDLAGDRITLPTHRLIDGAKVVFVSESSEGRVPDGLADDRFYYVKVISADVIELYNDPARTQKIDLTSGGIGETRLLDATGKATVEAAKENTKRFEAVELELLSDPNGTSPGYQLAAIDTKASVRIYDNETVGFRFILPGQQVFDSSSPTDKGYLTIAEHPEIDNSEEFSAAVFLVRPLSDPGTVQTGTNAGQDNWVTLRFNPRWDQNIAQEMQVHLAEEPKFKEDGTQTVTISVYDQYGRKIHFYERDPAVDGSASSKLTTELTLNVTKETWAEPIRLKSAVFFDVNGNGELDAGEHSGVTLSDSRYYFGDNLSALAVGTDLANFNVTLGSFDTNQDGYLSLFETTQRPDQPAGWGIISGLANAAAIAVQVGDSIGKVAIPGSTDVAVDRWNRFAVFTSFAASTPDTPIKLVAEDGVPPSTLLPSDYSSDPYFGTALWKENAAYFDSNNWTRFQRIKLTALDDETYDIDRILPLEMKVYEAEGNDGFYSKTFNNAPSPLVLTVKDRRLDNETVTGSLANGFSKLEEIINNYSLPLIGSLSGKLPPFLTSFIRDFSRNLEQQRYITGPSLAAALSDALNEQLDGTGVNVSIKYDAKSQTIAMSLAFGQDYDLFEVSLDSDLGLPVLGLETEGSLSSIFHFDLRVGLTLDLKNRAFTLDISEDDLGKTKTGASTNLYLDLNSFKATGNVAFLRAELEQIPLNDFINGHQPQLTLWLDEVAKVGQSEQTVTVRAYDISGNPVDLDLTSANTFATYTKNAANWKHPIILSGLNYAAIDEISVDFNGSVRRFRVNWKGERDVQGLKVDARLYTQDPHKAFQAYNSDKNILNSLKKNAESESLLAKGDTHSEAALGLDLGLLGPKVVDVKIERKYAFAIATQTADQAMPTLYTGDKPAGTTALSDFLADKGPQTGTFSVGLGGIDNNSPVVNHFVVELFRLIDPSRQNPAAGSTDDAEFFPGLKLEPVNFTLGAAIVDPEDPYPQTPLKPLRRQLTAGGSSNSVILKDINGQVIDFATGLQAGNLPVGSDLIFRVSKTAAATDGLPPGAIYYVQPFNQAKPIKQVADYLVVSGPSSGGPLNITITNPDEAKNATKKDLVDVFIVPGSNVNLAQTVTEGGITARKLANAQQFIVENTATGAKETYDVNAVGTPIRQASVGISELSSRAKELFDYTLSGSLGAAFNLVTSVMGNTSFPSLSVDLAIAAKADKSKGKEFDLSLAVGLKDLGLDLGSFITKFAAPVISAVDSIFKPIKPFVEVLSKDTQFLEYIGLESQFDKDANGEVSILEIALVLSAISKQRGEAKYAEFFETIVKIVDFIKALDKLNAKLAKGDNLVVPLLEEYYLSLTPDGDKPAEDSKELPKKGSETSKIEHQAETPALPGTAGMSQQAAASGNENAAEVKGLLDKIRSIKGLRFPILEDPVSLVNLLFGKDVNLVLYEVPDLKIELNPKVEFRPFPAYPVTGVLEGRFEIGAQLGFGYDTYGFRKWSEADFSLKESYQIFDGFFLTDWTLDSYLSSSASGIVDKAELYAKAEVEAGVKVGAGLTGYLGVGVGANVNFDLEDKGEYKDNLGTSDGKVRGSEIIAGISDPLSLFELYGRIYAFLRALIEVDLGIFSFKLFEQRWDFELFKFQVGGAKQNGAAVQSEVVGGVVFFDANFNLKFDEGEPWGVTLGDGSYSFGIDPAEFDIDGDGKLTLMDGQLVVIGGRDLQTGLPIVNPMIASPESGIVSPLTTLATQMAVSNGGDLAASTAVVKAFFNLPSSLDLSTFHPIEAIRSGSADAALGLQVYKSHIIIDTLVYNLSRVAGGYSPEGITADLVINVLDFVAEQLRTAVLDGGDTFEERLSAFVESVVAGYFQTEILPTLTGNALAEAQIEQGTIVTVLGDTYDRVASAATNIGGSPAEIQQAFENLTPLKILLKTDIPAALDLYQQEIITAGELGQRSQQTLSEVLNRAPGADGSKLFTGFNTYEGATVGGIFGAAYTDDSGDSFYGVAIVGYTPQVGLGTWAYYDANQLLWFTLDQPITPDRALVLEANTRLRFIPQAGAEGLPTPSLAVRLIDLNGQSPADRVQTGDRINFEGSGAQPIGGTTPYSTDVLTFTTTITALGSGMSTSPSLTQTTAAIDNLAFAWEDGIPQPQGATVNILFGQYFESNSGNNFYGIAIGDYKVSPSQGQWQYYTVVDVQQQLWGWVNIPAINPQANDNQFLLRADTLLRFAPATNYAGPAPLLKVNLIDDRVLYPPYGGGFSSGSRATIAIDLPNSFTPTFNFQTLVYGVNDAPVNSLSATFNQTEAVRISDRASATTADLNPIAGRGDLYPSVLKVSGLLGKIADMSVTLKGLDVTADNNLDIWLEGPQGQRVVLLSDAGNGTALNNFTLTFNNAGAPALAGSTSTLVNNNIYRPTNNSGGANDLDPAAFAGAATAFDPFIGQSGSALNGDWKLYIEDDTDSGVDAEKFGRLLNGWSITFNRTAGSFAALSEDTQDTQGMTVADLFGSHFADVDGDSLKGIAIINNASTALEGKWQYWQNNAWADFKPQLTEINAMLLTADTRVRFSPTANFNGNPGAIVGRLVDGSHPDFTSGKIQDARFTTSGGPFSQGTISKTLTVTPVNDAPTVVAGAAPVFPSFLEDVPLTTANAPTVNSLFASSFQDLIDSKNVNQNTFIGVAIVQDFPAYTGDRATDLQIASEKGNWQVYDIRFGQWISLPSDVSETNAYLVPKDTQVRFLPKANYNGPLPSLRAYLVDNGEGQALGLGQRINLTQTGVGGTTRYTADTVTLKGAIEAVNDFRPWAKDVLTPISLSASGQDEDTTSPPAKTVAELFGPRFVDGPSGSADGSDGDQFDYTQTEVTHGILADASFWGVLIKDVPASTVGVWEYSASGTTWVSVGGWSQGQGLYLPESYRLRFRQTAEHYNDTMTGTNLGPAHPLVAYLVDGSVTDTNLGYLLSSGQSAIAAITSADPIPNRPERSEASPISVNGLTLQQAINAVNDAPTVAATGNLLVGGNPVASIVEDGTPAVYLSGIAIADVDANESNPDGSLTVTLSVDSGSLTVADDILNGLSAGQIGTNGTASVQLTGTLAQINTTLAALTAVQYQSQADFNGEVEVAIAVTDNGNVGQGGAKTASATRTITVTAVNDRPTVEFNNPSVPLTVDSNSPLYITDIAIGDVDSQLHPNGKLSVTLKVLSGKLTVNPSVGNGVTADDITYSSNGSEVTLLATLAQIQATLKAPTGLSYQGLISFSGNDLLEVSVNDNGNTGSGGDLTAVLSRTIVVEPKNTAPLATKGSIQLTTPRSAVDLGAQTVANLFGSAFDDSADQGTLRGVAIVANGANPQTQGTWQYSTDKGGSWKNLPTQNLSATNAFVLAAKAQLRFQPLGNYAGQPGSLSLHLIDNTAIVPSGELGIDVSKRGGTTPYSQDLITLSTRIVIENSGGVLLGAQANQQLFVEVGGVQTAVKLSGAQISVGQFAGWEILAAETINGQNQGLWKNAGANLVGVWNLDSSWNYQSGVNLSLQAPQVIGLETSFGVDIDGNGVIGPVPPTTIENIGSVELLRGSAGDLLVKSGTSQTAVKLNGAPVYVGQFPGWEMIAAETINGQNQGLWRNISTNQAGIWQLDSNWNYQSGTNLSLQAPQIAGLETSFGVDVNGDGAIGQPVPRTIESAGNVNLIRGSAGNLLVNSGSSDVAVKLNGAPISVGQFAGWEMLAAETFNGQNQGLWKNAGANLVGVWNLDSNWNYQSGVNLSLQAPQIVGLETSFGVDINGNGVVGPVMPSVIENVGSVNLIRGASGNLLVNSGGSDVAVKLNGAPIVVGQFAGWEMLAAETINGQNQGLWRNTSANVLGVWNLDSNWNYQSGRNLALNSVEAANLLNTFLANNGSVYANDNVLVGDAGNNYLDGGAGNDDLSGLDGNDVLLGGPGNDVISGGNGNDTLVGGTGNDTLTGGSGLDRFVFNSPQEGVDTITDFSVADDLIVLSASGFGGQLVANSPLASAAFHLGTSATAAGHRVIYDASSGALFFDPDGSGGQTQTQIATLGTGLGLTQNNVFVAE